jgi:very-short-patch-repair endonuclease
MSGGSNMDKIKCWVCGKTATKTRPVFDGTYWFTPDLSRHRRCYCDDCYDKAIREERENQALYIKLKHYEMFVRGVKLLENQKTDMYEYQEAIEAVREFLDENPDKFDSSYEVLTAIVLIQNRIRCKMQYKVGRYQVDFLLPDLLVVLEIDGDRHKHRKEYDRERDAKIKSMLGQHWEIIRIPTEHLDKNAKKIPEAINKVLEYRETNHINWRAL